MADKPFDRVVTHTLERPLSSDLNLDRSQHAATQMLTAYSPIISRSSLASFLPATSSSQFWGASFFPFAGTGMQVVLQGGWGWIYNPTLTGSNIGGISQVNDVGDIYPLYLSGSQAISVPAADATNPRIDIIEVAADRRFENPLTRDVFDPALEVFTPTLLNKGLTYDLLNRTSINGSAAINYKTGTPAGSPAAPSVTAGYIKIAEVYVDAAVTSIVQSEIADYRPVAFPGGVAEFSARCSWSSDTHAQVLTVTNGVATTGLRIGLFTLNTVSGLAGFGRVLNFCVLHPNVQKVICSSHNWDGRGYTYGGQPLPPPYTADSDGNIPLPTTQFNILSGFSSGYTVYPTPGPTVPLAGRNQPSAVGGLVPMSHSTGAWGGPCVFDVSFKIMVTP